MRPRVIHELSRHLAIRLETGIQGGSVESRIPVYLCHPLEALDGQDAPADSQAAGVLYLYRVGPDTRYPQGGPLVDTGRGPGMPHRLKLSGFWLRLRYAFLVVGGTLEDELVILAAALRHLHERPFVEAAELCEEEDDEEVARDPASGGGILPLSVVDDPMVWREIGLEEHRLAVNFEARLPLPSSVDEVVQPVFERELRVELPGPDREGGRHE